MLALAHATHSHAYTQYIYALAAARNFAYITRWCIAYAQHVCGFRIAYFITYMLLKSERRIESDIPANGICVRIRASANADIIGFRTLNVSACGG